MKKKMQITHTMKTIQLLLSHATVRELHNCSRDIHFSETMGVHEYTRSPQDYWSNQFRLFLEICI